MSDLEDQLTNLIDDRDFQTLDRRFGRFNLFEAVGAVRGELRHSNFLAFLMSPHESHGLGSAPLQRILRGFNDQCPRELRPIGSLRIAVGDLDNALVFRERDNIDLLVEIKELNLIVVVENKVDARAGDGQLARYKALIRAKYPGWRQLFVFLTPDGDEPEEDDWVAYSYVNLARIFDTFAADSSSLLPTEVALVFRHYVEMLRRHIVPDDELKELALQIYQRHQDSLDFIFECRPDISGSLLSIIRPLLEAQSDIIADRHSPSILRFVPKAWTVASALTACPKEQWTKTSRNVIFEVKSFKDRDRILLSLILGPSDPVLRQYLFDSVRAESQTFVGANTVIGKSWVTIFARELLSDHAAENMEEEEKHIALKTSWEAFLRENLPKLTEAIARIAAAAPPVT